MNVKTLKECPHPSSVQSNPKSNPNFATKNEPESKSEGFSFTKITQKISVFSQSANQNRICG